MTPTLKRLTLIRHGDAIHSQTNDKTRLLSSQGTKEAFEVGRHLDAEGVTRALVFCSPALRTQQTLFEVQRSLKIERIESMEEIYSCNTALELLTAIKKRVSDAPQDIVLVGHNPTISGLVSLLSDSEVSMKTGNAIILTLETDSWETALESDRLWTIFRDFRP